MRCAQANLPGQPKDFSVVPSPTPPVRDVFDVVWTVSTLSFEHSILDVSAVGPVELNSSWDMGASLAAGTNTGNDVQDHSWKANESHNRDNDNAAAARNVRQTRPSHCKTYMTNALPSISGTNDEQK